MMTICVNLGGWGEVDEDDDRHSDDAIAYSPNDVLTKKDFSQYTEADIEEARQIIAKFAYLLATKLSRRKVGTKGDSIDFRYSWRKNIAYGGEPLKLIRKRRKVKKKQNSAALRCQRFHGLLLEISYPVHLRDAAGN